MKIAVVEDEKVYQEMFRNYIDKYSSENGISVDVTCFDDGFDITEDYTPVWDVILLDIQMKHQDGMTAAKIIRKHDERVAIMFITTLAQYAIMGYEVDATDYVLKPVEYEKFAFRFSRVLRHVENEETQSMLLPSENGSDKVLLPDILYIQVDHHNLTIHVKNGAQRKAYTLRKSISSIEKELPDKFFFRCDQSVIVNLRAITRVEKDCVRIGDTILPVSRSRRKAFMEAISCM